MRTFSNEQLDPLYVVPGAWHTSSHTEAYRYELAKIGFTDTYAPDIPGDQPGANYDNDTDVICDAMNGRERINLILQSRPGALVPRILNHPSIDVAQFTCILIVNSAGPDGFQLPGEPESWPRHSEEFLRGKGEPQNGLMEYDPNIARRVFFNRAVNQRLVNAAIQDLRPHRVDLPKSSSPLPDLPPKSQRPPIFWAIGDYDRVHNRRTESEVAKLLYGIPLLNFAGSHTPFIAQPEAFAHFTRNIVNRAAEHARVN